MSSTWLWYLSRASGLASLVLLTAVLVLGLVTAGRRAARPLQQTMTTGLHRSLALGSVTFLTLHVVTAIVDSYVPISWWAMIVPLGSDYQRSWVALGTLALDIIIAVVVTSLLRHRLPERAWREVHTLAFLLWPLALLHGYGMGTSDQPLLRLTVLGCGVVGVGALLWRSTHSSVDELRRSTVARQVWR